MAGHRIFGTAFCLAALAFAGPAYALDCSKASNDTEKAICDDPEAQKADAAMSAAYSALKATLKGPEAAALLATQRAWIEERNSACIGEGPVKPGCLVGVIGKRTAFLEGRPEAGTYGAGALAPVLQSRKSKGKGDWDISVGLSRFRDPKTEAEKAFNKAVDKLAAETPLKEPAEPEVPAKSYNALMSVTYASDRLLAAETNVWRYDGGAHGSSVTSHIAIDGATGKPVSFDAMFDKAGAEKATKLCEAQIVEQRKEKDAVQPGNAASAEGFGSVPEAFRQIGSWRFGASETQIVFDPYEIGSYAEGAYDCTFKNTELKPLMKPDFPLP